MKIHTIAQDGADPHSVELSLTGNDGKVHRFSILEFEDCELKIAYVDGDKSKNVMIEFESWKAFRLTIK